MMTDTMPVWVAVAMILVTGISALYVCYIRPGYERDRKARHARNSSWLDFDD